MLPKFKAGKRVENAHEDEIWSVGWSSAGKIITGSVDETVKAW